MNQDFIGITYNLNNNECILLKKPTSEKYFAQVYLSSVLLCPVNELVALASTFPSAAVAVSLLRFKPLFHEIRVSNVKGLEEELY